MIANRSNNQRVVECMIQYKAFNNILLLFVIIQKKFYKISNTNDLIITVAKKDMNNYSLIKNLKSFSNLLREPFKHVRI